MNDLPARKIKNNYGKNTGFFPSKKNQRGIAYESLLERDYMYLLEFDKSVLSFIEQPIQLKYNYLGKTRIYTPDIKVIRKDTIQIIEIKPKEKLIKMFKREVEKVRFDAASYYCAQHGLEFKFITEENIRNGPLLENIKYLFRYSKINVPLEIENIIRKELSLSELEIYKLLEVVCMHHQYDRWLAYIYSLLYEGVLKIDLTIPISQKSIIRL